jgi:hypothetical protein
MYGLRGLGLLVDNSTPCDVINAYTAGGVGPDPVTMVPGPGGIPMPDQAAVAGLARWTFCTSQAAAAPSPTPAATPPVISAPAAAVTPAPSVAPESGFDWSSIPWWGYAVAAGVAWFLLGGRK